MPVIWTLLYGTVYRLLISFSAVIFRSCFYRYRSQVKRFVRDSFIVSWRKTFACHIIRLASFCSVHKRRDISRTPRFIVLYYCVESYHVYAFSHVLPLCLTTIVGSDARRNSSLKKKTKKTKNNKQQHGDKRFATNGRTTFYAFRARPRHISTRILSRTRCYDDRTTVAHVLSG